MDKKQTLIGRLVWTGRKSIGAGLLLVVVLVGMLLLNPAAFGSQIDEESQQTFSDDTVLKHKFSGNPNIGRLRAVLRLESFRGQTGEELDVSISYILRPTAIEPDDTCDSNAFWGRPSNQIPRNWINRDDPLPILISNINADSHDSGKQLCYHVNLNHDYDYYYSTGVVPEIKAKSIPERPILSFDQRVRSRGWNQDKGHNVQLSLGLKPNARYPGWLSSRTAMIIQTKVVDEKSDCQTAAFGWAPNPNFREDDHHKMIYVNQISSDPLWFTERVFLDDTSRFACWRVWVDPERDNQNWQAYYYAGPRLPRAWSTTGSALAGDGNTTFNFSLIDETEASYRIRLSFAEYGGSTGKLAQPLKYSLKAKPIYRQSDCDAGNFVKPGESLDYIEKAGDMDRVPSDLINRSLPDLNAYSQKFICFQVVITPSNASWYQIIQSQYQTYYYASERLPEMSGPAFSHRIQTKTGPYPKITLRLQSLGEKTNPSANITSIIVTLLDQAADCFKDFSGREILDAPINIQPPVDLATITLDDYIYDGKFICLDIAVNGKYHRYATERIDLNLPDLPDEWTIEEAVRLFKRQLTDEGLRALQGVEFVTSPNGCQPSDTSLFGAGGCWVQSERRIYINDDYFPEGYAYANKINIIKNTVDVLMHETNHAIDSYRNDGLYYTIYYCFDATSASSGLFQQLVSWFTTNNRRYNYQEQLDEGTEACLLEDSTWGEVIKNLKTEKDRHDWVADWVPSSEGEVFSTSWYVEFYAELPTVAPALSTLLENHYDQYYKDRSKLADVVEDRQLWFD